MIILVVDLFVVQYFFYALMDIKKNNINEDNPSHPTGIKVPYVCLMVNAAKHVYSDMHKRGEKFGVNQTGCWITHCKPHIRWSKGHEIQCRIKQKKTELHRCQIRHVLLLLQINKL